MLICWRLERGNCTSFWEAVVTISCL